MSEKITLDEYILQNGEDRDWAKLSNVVNTLYGTRYNRHSIRAKHRRLSMAKKGPPKEDNLAEDRKVTKLSQTVSSTKKKYEEAKSLIESLERERDAVKLIQEFSHYEIPVRKPSKDSESVAVVLASDWHVEENVLLGATNGLNEYNLSIAETRAKQFFQHTLRLIEIFQKDTKIDTLVLALLGDFISGSIHEDIAENTNLGPVDALRMAEGLIISGIQFLLDNSRLNLIVPCHSGNHGRATKEQRFATENENSFEYYMYHVIANHFEGNKRVKFLISPSYISYLTVFDTTIRFHHGHGMKYGGGIGGLFIPAYKAVARWNDGRRADIDCFGHFHQFRDGGSFICNGSMIGYNAYAVGKGISFEKPKQVMFVVERERGRTFTVPISFK